MDTNLDMLLGTVLNSEMDLGNITAPRNDKIYHYTSQEAVLSIIDNNCFYASNALYLNDISELKYGKDVIKSVINKLLNDKDYEYHREKWEAQGVYFLQKILSEVENQTLSNIYVLCFSRSKDLLSQWRGYGDNGIQIELSSSELFYCFDSNYIAKDVVYSREKQEQIILEELETLLNFAVFGYDWIDFPSEELDGFPSAVSRILHNSIIWFKDIAWKEEKEFRVVYNPLYSEVRGGKLKIKYRTNGKIIVPYVELCANKDGLPITQLMISPGLNQDRIFQGLNFFVAEKSLSMIEVVKSKIPFMG